MPLNECVCGESWAKERVWDTSGTLSNPHPVNQVFMSHISHTHFFILSLIFSLHKREGRIKEMHNADKHETSGPFYKKINRGPTKKRREGEREINSCHHLYTLAAESQSVHLKTNELVFF